MTFFVFFKIVANSFLANLSTSALFATILVEYLLERLPEMGSNVELSNLYLKLFKLVFGSVSLFAAENEQMLKVSCLNVIHAYFALCVWTFCLSIECLSLVHLSASPPQNSEQLHGAGPVSERTLQLLSAPACPLSFHWWRQP